MNKGFLQIFSSILFFIIFLGALVFGMFRNAWNNFFENRANELTTLHKDVATVSKFKYDPATNVLVAFRGNEKMVIDFNYDSISNEQISSDDDIYSLPRNENLLCFSTNDIITRFYQDGYSIELSNESKDPFIEVSISNNTLKVYKNGEIKNTIKRNSHGLNCVIAFPGGSERLILIGDKIESLKIHQ